MRNIKIILSIILCFLLPSCSPSNNNNDEESIKSVHKDTNKTSLFPDNLNFLAISSNTLKLPTIITTEYINGDVTINYLKQPLISVNILLQTIFPADDHNESKKISALVIRFPDITSAEKEAKINFDILKAQAKHDSVNIQTFETNTLGDESIAITFYPDRKYPVYLYTRIQNILIKINGGREQNMENLLEVSNHFLTQLNDYLKDQR